MFRLDGQCAVVTGGCCGIGQAIVRRFVAAGATVFVLDCDAPQSPIPGAVYQQVDVSDASALETALKHVADTHSQCIDILVNNAGIQPLGPTLAETSNNLINQTFETNVFGTLNGLNQVTQWMPHGGRIINNASFIAMRAAPHVSAYGLSKNAILYLTRVAAIELAPKGITVNCVCPATVNTPAVTDIEDNPELQWAERVIPLKRIAEPEDVAATFHFLASPEAAYITGQAIAVDGGATAGFAEHDVAAPPQLQNGKWVGNGSHSSTSETEDDNNEATTPSGTTS
jgi:NAD(P)-dependent dehydrogenase (short-subunit alcohol dehydrogenase family)